MHRRRIDPPAVVMVARNAFQNWMGATRRLFHIAGAFRRLGFDVVLVTSRMTNPAIQRDIDLEFPGMVVRTNHTGYYPRLVDHSEFLRRVWRASWKILGEDVYQSNLSLGWSKLLNIENICNVLSEHAIRPTLIWGVSAGYCAGAVAAQTLAHRLRLPWVFELHDPPWGAGLGSDNDAIKGRFSSLLTEATYVVVTAESYGLFLEERYALPNEKWQAIHLTHDGLTLPYDQPKGEKFRLAYAGWLNQLDSRGALALVQALAEAFRLWPEMRKSVGLDFAGGGPGFGQVAHLVRELALEKNIRFTGVLPGNQVPEFIGSASVVVVIQTRGCALQVPGKVFESLKAGRPILGIMPPEYEAADIIRRSGLGFVHDPQDIAGIIETVRRLWEVWLEDSSAVQPDLPYIGQFSVEQLPIKIASILQKITDLPEPCGYLCEKSFYCSPENTV